jgi:2-methylcitrate dehydratase PrpD
VTQLTAFLERLLDEYASRPPASIRRHAARALFDFEMCAAAGSRVVPPHAFADRAAAAAAAAHALDRDDVHWPSITHPGAIVWPTVLSAAAVADRSGADAIRAAAVGYEVTARLATALGSSHRQYWHSTTTAGTVGAAVGAALALGLDGAGAATAAGHAISVAGGFSQTIVERSGTRLFYRAHAATTGIASAHAAQAGLDATRLGLEGGKAIAAATAPGTDVDLAGASRPVWAIEELWLRVHSATGFAHTAIDAAAKLGPVDRAAVRSIAIEVPAIAAAVAGNLAPSTRDEGWWSVPYSVAVTLLSGTGALDTADLVDVSDLLSLTSVTGSSDDLAATVTVDTGDGAAPTASCALPLGYPDRPLEEEQLLAKWRLLDVGPAAEAVALLELASRLPDGSVREYLAGRPASTAPLGPA